MINKFIDYIAFFFKKIKYRIKYFNKNVYIHNSSIISPKSDIKVLPPKSGTIKIGKNCRIHDYAMILTYRGNIEMGDNCSLNPFSILYGHGGLKIGNGVRIAAHTVVIPSNHKIDRIDIPIFQQGHEQKGIIIENDVWIGANCTILDGVVIGKGCVIGAGSVVTRSIPEYSVAAGVPAKVMYKRGEKL